MRFMANFKCNHTPSTTRSYLQALNAHAFTPSFFTKHSITIFPPATSLEAAMDMSGNIRIGAQNAYPSQAGALTGTIGLQMLESIGVQILLLGHSECREIFKQSQQHIATIFDFYTQAGFEIVYCIGESASIRAQGASAVQEHLYAQFVGINTTSSNLCVAYEPIWAIGSGESASIEDIAATHAFLRSITAAPLLYGGSVNATNAGAILQTDNVDGVLIGSFALQPQGLVEIINALM